jgi:hypothetical protein
MSLPLAISACRAPASLLRSPALRRRPKFHSCPPRFGKPDGNRLLGRAHAMFALANVLNLLAHKLARLRARGFALAHVFPRASHGLFIGHGIRYFRAGARCVRPLPCARPLEGAVGCVPRTGPGVAVAVCAALLPCPAARNWRSASSQCSRSRPSGCPRSMKISYARRAICSWEGVELESVMCFANG